MAEQQVLYLQRLLLLRLAVNAKPVAAAVPVAKAPVQISSTASAQMVTIKAESLEDIKTHWNALTHEVSRQKMALATYLQEGAL